MNNQIKNDKPKQPKKDRAGVYGALMILGIIAIVIVLNVVFWIIPAQEEVERTQNNLEQSKAECFAAIGYDECKRQVEAALGHSVNW